MAHFTDPSQRSDIPMFRVLDILRQVNEREAEGADIIRMGAGQPNVGAPQGALDYAIAQLHSDPKQAYTAAMGMPALKERIAAHYKITDGVTVNPDNVAITTGSSGGFILNFIAAFDAGARVGIITPAYPAYRNILKVLNIEVVEIPARAEDGYQPTVALLETYGKDLDGLIINSPSNPCGTVIGDDVLKDICAWCTHHGVQLISDEAYQGITYDSPASSALRHTSDAMVMNTFSKYYAMTGWRLGWSVLPDHLVNRVKKLAESLFVSPPTIAQHVAYKIYDHLDVLEGYVADYRANRDVIMRELPKAGFENITSPDGAFYVYADTRTLHNDSQALCRDILDNAHVSISPGIDFDLERGHHHVRICYADSLENIIAACDRLKDWYHKR